MKSKKWMWVGTLLFATFFQNVGESKEIYHVTGKIKDISQNAFSIQTNDGVFWFNKDQTSLKEIQNYKTNEVVTVWYALDAKKVTVATPSEKHRQEAGQMGIFHQKIIQDDRAFYDARNDHKQNVHKPNDG